MTIIGSIMPPLALSQEFPSLRHFKEALHAWAIESHFEPRILKSDTGRVRVGCKRDPDCLFVVRCNWERKQGREPLARVTVLRDRHTCLNRLEWRNLAVSKSLGDCISSESPQKQPRPPEIPPLEIRTDPSTGFITGGARALGKLPPLSPADSTLVPMLPKVQRNTASRLPFLLETLPRLMQINKDTAPVQIRECLIRKYGQEVQLKQCRRAKTEILKRCGNFKENQVMIYGDRDENSGRTDVNGAGERNNGDTKACIPNENLSNVPICVLGIAPPNAHLNSIHDPVGTNVGLDSVNNRNGSLNVKSHLSSYGSSTQNLNEGLETERHLSIHAVDTMVASHTTTRAEQMLDPTTQEQAVRCPYCVNNRWMRTVKDAVDHMSMHVVL